ncbi:MAG: hypothetical protein RLZZ292_1630 [Bacteroidota bacterium]|jgi:FAD/FMN-containing dehydrogenase
MYKQIFQNWGNYSTIEAIAFEEKFEANLQKTIRSVPSLIARGNGRCYGDSSLNDYICSMQQYNKILCFDTEKGIIEAQSGVLLSDLLTLVVPKGYFLFVTPGTKFITLGGAIAADVHGKNHLTEGSFSRYLISFDLLTANAEIITCSKTENATLFWQTCGGMGLTGIILKVTFQLKKIPSAFVQQKSIKVPNLETLLEQFEEHKAACYTVAWLDCLQKGKQLGKGILTIGKHCAIENLTKQQQKQPFALHPPPKYRIPFYLPNLTLNHLTARTFNYLYYLNHWKEEKKDILHYNAYFYPLDAICDWNKLYGRNGFLQYQFVLPIESAKKGLLEILSLLAQRGEASFLAVLKRMGDETSNAVMSFPKNGYSLALDFKVTPSVFVLLNELDQIVAHHGGRIYLAKDARMSADFFHQTYTKKINTDGFFQSLQSKRLQY